MIKSQSISAAGAFIFVGQEIGKKNCRSSEWLIRFRVRQILTPKMDTKKLSAQETDCIV
jgi:hypothetical protein